METRTKCRSLVNSRIDLDKLPESLRGPAYDFFSQYKGNEEISKSEICRLIYTRSELSDLALLPLTTLALALRVTASLVSQIKAEASSSSVGDAEKRPGRPCILPPSSMEALTAWIREECSAKRFPTLRELKHEIILELERLHSKFVPCQSWYHATIKKLLGEAFLVKYADPLEEDRFDVSPEVITAYSNGLNDERLRNVNPRLFYNIDETGFGMSNSGRLRRQKVIVPREMQKNPVYREKKESHFVSAIACFSMTGKVLPPGLVTKRSTDHPDASRKSFYGVCRRYTSEKAFVTRSIFEDYVRNVLMPDIDKYRQKHPDEPGSAVLLMDGHSAHKSMELRAFCGMNDITVLLLPPHSSHLCQPLDRGFFRRLKAQYSSFPIDKTSSKITNTLERIFEAFQACKVTGFIWRCWEHAGIAPEVKDGKVRGYVTDRDKILQEPALNHAVVESAQGRRTVDPSFGILNEDEHLLFQAGQCPYCCAVLDD